MEQKKFMDIKRIVQENEMHKNKNTWAFEPGDHIVIQIKIDGSNASVRYDPETGKLAAFSRKQQIVRTKDVDATSKFLDYVDTLDAEKFQKYPDYVFFGEWMTRHRVPYPEKYLNIWIMYDVYDLKADGYLPQKQVKALAAEVGVPYIHVLYDGPFVDWDHCRSFMRITKYTDGDCEEGIIVKNMSKLNNPDSRAPFVLKIVNEKFSEMKAQKAPITSEQEAAKKMAFATVERMVTRERVEKELYKMRDEGILPEEFGTAEWKLIAPVIAKRIYADYVKEEAEAVEACGKLFSKMCGGQTMNLAKSILKKMDEARGK